MLHLPQSVAVSTWRNLKVPYIKLVLSISLLALRRALQCPCQMAFGMGSWPPPIDNALKRNWFLALRIFMWYFSDSSTLDCTTIWHVLMQLVVVCMDKHYKYMFAFQNLNLKLCAHKL